MNINKKIHLVSFNIPYPPNYGGIIDVYYKLYWFKKSGIQVILHCFAYGREESEELEKLCHKVHYYKRYSGLKYFFKKTPYIVATRSNEKLLYNFQKDNYPIIFEGLHTTHFLNQLNKERNIIIRTHNIEHSYYKYLKRQESNIFRKFFFYTESLKLKKYENILSENYKIASISEFDNTYFNNKYKSSTYIPAFHMNNNIKCKIGIGKYLLYHGNLSVSENIQAIKFIANKVINKIPYKLIIAGKNPSKKLKHFLRKFSNIELIENPSDEFLEQLITNAQINILPTFQDTGIKLKLLHALFLGRHCLVNNKMVENTGLEKLCTINETPDDFINSINLLMETPFSENNLIKRKNILTNKFSNRENINKLINLLKK